MKLKAIVTIVLLLFVAASIVYLVVEESGGKPAQDMVQTEKHPAATQKEENSVPDNKSAKCKVVVYYFHGNFRCMTCRTIEAYAKEAVDTGFPDALKGGRLKWRVVNVDEPDNEHYVKEFQITTRSVVLERLADGKRQDWKNLQRVWELVRGNKDAFLTYVQDEIKVFLEADNQ